MNASMNSTLCVAQLLRLLQRVEGRKKFHKLVHILQELDCPFPERFEYSSYGMYSRELRREVASLVQDKLVEERPEPNMASEFTYTIKARPELEKFLDRLEVEKQPVWASRATRLNSLPTQELEGISTILFLRSRGFEGEKLKARLLALKPHLANIFSKCEREAKTLKATPVAA